MLAGLGLEFKPLGGFLDQDGKGDPVGRIASGQQNKF